MTDLQHHMEARRNSRIASTDLRWLCESVWVQSDQRCSGLGLLSDIGPVLYGEGPSAGGAGGVGVRLGPSGRDCPSGTVEIARSEYLR